MSKKRTKQYLMLLMVVGLVSIAAGGGGTFASFSAETANTGNYFATGSLILNDTGDTNTCTSAVDSGNVNSTGIGCDTLFKLKKFTFPTATTTTGAIDNTSTSINFSGLTAPIYKGDTIEITDGTNDETVTADATAFVGDTSVAITGNSLAHSYAIGSTITDNNATYFATLQLTNAGTIDASGINFEANGTPCSNSYQTGHTTLATGFSAGDPVNALAVDTTWSVAQPFSAGDPVVVSNGSNSQTFIVSADTASGAASIPVQSATANDDYATSDAVSGPEFANSSTATLCDKLKLSILETDATYDHDASTAALGCAFGDNTTPPTGQACNYSTGGTALDDSSLTSWQSLSLATGANSNSGVQLTHGQSRYFVLAVHFTGATFDNSYQNRAAANLDLHWQINQA